MGRAFARPRGSACPERPAGDGVTIVALSTEPADAGDELRRLMAAGDPPEHRLFLVAPRPAWMADGACSGAEVDCFADDPASIEAAKAVCEHCPVRLAC